MPSRRPRSTVLAALVASGAAVLATAVALAGPSLTASSPSSATPRPVTAAPAPAPAPGPTAVPRLGPGRALGASDGIVPDGVTVFDVGVPAVARLDPALLGALRRAASDAGIPFTVTSGWRSAAYQEELLREAISTHGSAAEAARWVATPETSAHVSGDAVDVGSDAAAWLARHGAAHGLCQVYGNEPWHYELRPAATAQGCPAPYPDPTHDPRMQR